ncbi:phage tail protein [Cellulomonas sp. URHD0024]|uniref:phage tail protein n=1 Tax=Cellulomonas sp. URHD0024 TaxID=1302620 RepID=UPI00040951E0|nr:phage tail protein [Cellulomonas sp. URHD0024]
MSPDSDYPANTLRFDVTIDGLEIGSFTAIDGLSAQYEIKTYAEGGENGYVHRLPGRLSWGTIKLTRPVHMRTRELSQWFREVASGMPSASHTAAVKAMNDNRTAIVTWEFKGVWPVSYKGPSFAVDSGKIALEVFEFAHDGWTES